MTETMPRLVETAVLGDAVRVRFADHPDAARTIEWVEFLVRPTFVDPDRPKKPEPDSLSLGEIRLGALRRAQDIIGAEMRRLEKLSGRAPQ